MKKLLVICFLACVALVLVGAAFAGDMGKSETVNGWIRTPSAVRRARMPPQPIARRNASLRAPQ